MRNRKPRRRKERGGELGAMGGANLRTSQFSDMSFELRGHEAVMILEVFMLSRRVSKRGKEWREKRRKREERGKGEEDGTEEERTSAKWNRERMRGNEEEEGKGGEEEKFGPERRCLTGRRGS
eukprot:746191-Hanusia_phi.AAC.2